MDSAEGQNAVAAMVRGINIKGMKTRDFFRLIALPKIPMACSLGAPLSLIHHFIHPIHAFQFRPDLPERSVIRLHYYNMDFPLNIYFNERWRVWLVP
jgi:hypothetical protein